MRIENVILQLRSAAERAGLAAMFGEIRFDAEDVDSLRYLHGAERTDVPIANQSGPVGVLHVEVRQDADPDYPASSQACGDGP